ncbi:unnamed protein product, partial [Mesorhabditis belari]|uniref:Uncharacterized protein n=1 Tax=Mesorhabditis belari TaxID=2138241 RepID=A0AAF3FSX2_9BILA
MQASLLSALILAFVAAVSCASLAKKADEVSSFVSGLNGAARLRYGKRSPTDNQESSFLVDQPMLMDNEYVLQPYGSNGYALYKRSPSAKSLIESLNGAERLRFGRK